MHSVVLNLPLPATYEFRSAKGYPRGLVILLHGYLQRGSVMMHKLAEAFPEDVHVLAPNGPFPIPPPLQSKTIRVGFSWYFFNPSTGVYVYNMDTATAFLEELVNHLGYASLPKWLFGFSQGGYLAPFAAAEMENVRQTVTLNGRYRSEVIDEVYPFRMDAVHGENDDMVDPVKARACHEEVMALGNEGTFVTVPSQGHELNEAMVAKALDLWEGK